MKPLQAVLELRDLSVHLEDMQTLNKKSNLRLASNLDSILTQTVDLEAELNAEIDQRVGAATRPDYELLTNGADAVDATSTKDLRKPSTPHCKHQECSFGTLHFTQWCS